MFTGIIEEIGKVKRIRKEGDNIHFAIEAEMSPELSIDQSISHNGCCLTVVGQNQDYYEITAIQETLSRTNLGELQEGDPVNLERGMRLKERLDGHIVQGHIDQKGRCQKIIPQKGSTIFQFNYDESETGITIPKGSVTINGVSLTVVESKKGYFSVAIIPYTLEHTTFKELQKGDTVNLEFDVIGKYVERLLRERS